MKLIRLTLCSRNIYKQYLSCHQCRSVAVSVRLSCTLRRNRGLRGWQWHYEIECKLPSLPTRYESLTLTCSQNSDADQKLKQLLCCGLFHRMSDLGVRFLKEHYVNERRCFSPQWWDIMHETIYYSLTLIKVSSDDEELTFKMISDDNVIVRAWSKITGTWWMLKTNEMAKLV